MITTVDGLRFGQLIISSSGRDSNQIGLIIGMIDDHYIEIADGIKHPVARAKKKNVKHVKVKMLIAKEIEESLLKGESIGDIQVKEAIQRLKNELEEGERFDG